MVPSRIASGFSRENGLRERMALQPVSEGEGCREEMIIVASKPRNESRKTLQDT